MTGYSMSCLLSLSLGVLSGRQQLKFGIEQWFKLIVKLVQKREKSFEADYDWLEMSFMTSWSQADGLVMFGFNTGPTLHSSLGITPSADSGAMEVLRWNCHLLERMCTLYLRRDPLRPYFIVHRWQ